MWRGVSHCHFNYTHDDPPFYLQDAHKLAHGYFAHNRETWAARGEGPELEFMRMTTEGGFPFLLFFVGKIDARLPFLINVLLWPLAIFMLAGLVRVTVRDSMVGGLAALFFPLLLLLNSQNYWLWKFCEPYRDPSAHLLAFGGLLLLATAARKHGITGRHVLLAGGMIGLAGWARIPNVLIAIPAALVIALWRRSQLKGLLWLWVLLGVGVVLGGLPLLGQSLFEGKGISEIGQMQSLAAGSAAGGELPKLHLFHLPGTLVMAVTRILKDLSWWIGLLAFAGVVIGLLTSWRSTLVICATGLTFLFFYSCYYSVKPRYFFPVHLCIVALAAHTPAWLFLRLSESRRCPARRSAALALLAVVICVVTGSLCVRSTRAWRRLADQWQSALRVEAWLAQEFDLEDVIVTNRRYLKTWVDYFSPGLRTRINWLWSNDDVNVGDKHGRGVVRYGWNADFIQPWDQSLISLDRVASIGNLLASGRKVYLLLHEWEDKSSPSWWRNDLDLHFDLVPYRSLRPDSSGVVYTAYEIVPPGNPLPLERALLAWSGAQLRRNRTLGINFDDYATAPTASRYLEGARLRWRGYQRWQRDCGGDGRPQHRSRAVFEVDTNTTIRLPVTDETLGVQLHMTVYCGDAEDREAVEEGIRFRLSNKAVPHARVCREGSSGDRYSCIYKVMIPASAYVDGRLPRLEVVNLLSPSTTVRLRRLEFMTQRPARLVSSSPTELPFVWPAPAEYYLSRYEARGKGPGNPYYRLLDSAVSIELPVAAGTSNAVIKLAVQTEGFPLDSSTALVFGVDGGRAFEHKMSGPTETSILCIPCRAADQTLRLDIQPRYGVSGNHPPAVLLSAEVLSLDDMAVPPAVSASWEDPFGHVLADFWSYENPSDGEYFRWTREQSNCHFPIFGEPVDLRMTMRIEPPYPSVGDRRVQLSINEHPLAPLTAHAAPGGRADLIADIKHEHLRIGLNTLTIKTEAWRPSDVLGTADHRQLGIHLAGLTWERP
jgi:hypothetical protein